MKTAGLPLQANGKSRWGEGRRWHGATLPIVFMLAGSIAAAGVPRGHLDPYHEQNDLRFRGADGHVVGTGAKRPNQQQWAWGEQHLLKPGKVKLNALGLLRVNRFRVARGQRTLDETQVEIAALGGEATAGPVQAAPGALPPYVDNSTLSSFPPVRSQGSLNSCAQFSAVYYTFTHMTALARGWDAKTGGDAYRFSPKWTYNAVNGGENAGTWHYDAYGIAQKHGIATWADFPYDTDYRAWCLDPATWRKALYVRADQAGKVADVGTEAGLTQLKQFLVNGYVLNFATYINSWQWRAISNDPGTVADDLFAGKQCVTMVNGTSGGHAMTIVGYSDDIWVDLDGDGKVAANEKGALRIANSWGTGWGEGGFCWVSYDALRTRNPAFAAEGLFWYDEATWVTARSEYQPRLVAEFTVNHLARNQLLMSLGASDNTTASPAIRWNPSRLLSQAGGPWAFDGLTTALDGTFCLDLTDLIPAAGGAQRYYLGMSDCATGNAAVLRSFKLVDLARGTEVASDSMPQSVDEDEVFAFIDYDCGGESLPPIAVISATATSGSLPVMVTFNGTGSYDPDGSIAGYAWDFGDGTTGTGAVCPHTYSRTGTFNITLTVTDGAGAQGATGVIFTASEPDVLDPPSRLSARASGPTVTLLWIDNATNETGYYVERGARSGKKGLVYTVAASLPANSSRFQETLPAGTYCYRVRAFNSSTGGVSAYSRAVSVRVR